MNYDEFLQYDVKNVYSEYTSVKKSKEFGDIPDSLVDVIPDKCECGSDNIIKRNLKRMKCCDPNCPIKLGKALSHMLSNFNVKGLGDDTCIKIINYLFKYDYLTIPSHVEVIGIKFPLEFRALFGKKAEILLDAIKEIKDKSMTFGKMINMISIPDFDSSCDELFRGVNNTAHFVSLVDNDYSVEGFMASRGVYDRQKIDSLRRSLPAILYFEQNLNYDLNQSSTNIRNICITGRITLKGHRVSKDVFVEVCNKLANVNGVQLFNVIRSTAMETCSYIICSMSSDSKKYLAGKRREQVEHRKILITPEEYIDLIKEEVEECKKKAMEECSTLGQI